MYIPKYYREEDSQKILAFLKQNNLAALVTFDGEKLIATHTPVEVLNLKTAGKSTATSRVQMLSIRHLASKKHCLFFRERILIFLRVGIPKLMCQLGIT